MSVRNESSLIEVLHFAENEYGYLSKEIQILVSEELNVPVSKVYGVITFYSYFTDEPRGEYNIQVCIGTGCYVKGADLTIMEEANEIMKHLSSGKDRPILTSCCPAWIKFIEHQFPSLTDIPSSCKSPHEMFGAVVKSYYAEKNNLKLEDIVVVSIMPCVTKKYEVTRPELTDEYTDVDYVLTTRELSKMIKQAGINLAKLEDRDFDNPLGSSTGAGTIFGATGGVLEAALRTVSSWVTGDDSDVNLDFTEVSGLEGIKEETLNIGGKEVRVAAASGLGKTRHVLDKIESGENKYDIIEIMACPGGCIAGVGVNYIIIEFVR